MQRRLRLACSLLLALGCQSAMAGDWIAMRVIDRDTNAVLPEYRHGGDIWVPGTPAHRYALELANGSDERLLVVLSVDGVNAVSGQTAGTSQTGYVLEPGETARIDGWRKSMSRVAQFVFTDVPDSYAARTGRPDNVGVIGAAVFRERREEPVYESQRAGEAAADAAAPTAATKESTSRQRIGTGHGASQWSPVGTTSFQRDSRSPVEVVSIRYDDLAALRRRGVIPGWRSQPRSPRPFPRGFVPDPPRTPRD